jgi:hypothetical protein
MSFYLELRPFYSKCTICFHLFLAKEFFVLTTEFAQFEYSPIAQEVENLILARYKYLCACTCLFVLGLGVLCICMY